MPSVAVFHPGTQHSWQTALAFAEVDKLSWYATSILYRADAGIGKFVSRLPGVVRKRIEPELKRRSFEALSQANVYEFGELEFLEAGARRLGLRSAESFFNRLGNVDFERRVARLTKKSSPRVLIGYNTASEGVFRSVKDAGILKVLDQTIGHFESESGTLHQEFERYPQAFFSSPGRAEGWWEARQREEHRLADIILCGSEFCAQTLIERGVDQDKIRIVPYGYDGTLIQRRSTLDRSGPLKCVFLGTLSARKGALHLLEAFQSIPPEIASLTIVGRTEVPEQLLSQFKDTFHHIPQVPKREVYNVLSGFDVLILPTLFEGSALGIYEAIGCGLAVIHSKASGHADYGNGSVLPAVSSEAIKQAVFRLASEPNTLAQAKLRSRELASEMEWGAYRARLRTLIADEIIKRSA